MIIERSPREVTHARKNCQSISHFIGSKGDQTAAKHRSDGRAAGITSGLSKLGCVVSGRLVDGVKVTATLPIVYGVAGYMISKGIKYLKNEWQLNVKALNKRWEIPIVPEDEK